MSNKSCDEGNPCHIWLHKAGKLNSCSLHQHFQSNISDKSLVENVTSCLVNFLLIFNLIVDTDS